MESEHRSFDLGRFRFESGATLEPFHVSYVCHGSLSPDRDNVVLVLTSIGGDHHRLDYLLGRSGAFDLDRWFVVAVDAIGNGLTTSPSTTGAPRTDFPRFTLRDMVDSQRRLLLEALGVDSAAVVVGASMGGMQALQWAVSHPDAVGRVVAMTPAPATSTWSRLVNFAARSALTAGQDWAGGEYATQPHEGWRRWSAVLHGLAGTTPDALDAAFPGPDGVERWLSTRAQTLADPRIDACDWVYQSWAYDAHDVGTTPGHTDTASALRSIRAPTLLLTPPLDLYNPVREAERIAALAPRARHEVIATRNGHLCTTGADPADAASISARVRRFVSGG